MGNKGKNLGWKIGGGIIVLLIGLVIGFGFWLAYEGDPKEIVSVADQFKPGAEWKLTKDDIEPPSNTCIDVECPSVSRKWESDTILSRQDLETMIHESRLELHPEKDCFQINETRPAAWCDANGSEKGYTIELRASNKKGANDRSVIRMYINKQ